MVSELRLGWWWSALTNQAEVRCWDYSIKKPCGPDSGATCLASLGKLEIVNKKKTEQANNDLPSLSPSDSESVSGSESGSVVSGAKVTFFSLLTPSEGAAVNKFYRVVTTE